MTNDDASAATPALRVGFVPGVTPTKWERKWGERFPGQRLELVVVAQGEQDEALRSGRVDMCFVRLPIDREGMHAIPLYREVPVVVVPKEHPISVYDEVSTADLADERVQDTADLDAAAGAIELVAANVGVAIVPHSIARLHHRRDVVFRTVTDAPDTQIALAWPIEATSDTTEEFVGIVRGRTERSSRSPSGREATGEQSKRSTQKPQKQGSGRPAAGQRAGAGRGRTAGARNGRRRGR
ncbi:LysR family substrate-binding domain-containing protein [Nocardia otitidiscaviarum]|uniref:LysR family substrate-binding domain-containing protein n=1 Tax=Nocardia otitidiscaviarum TaxID=1823 RepID=UPI001895C0FE|nr:LysR family substrate-binding domain-containing protein [Nocardia otitidiscaviarum]MBF6239033.1 LysR family substrate-binding domain-containing protein [Nocardia otitidiscaviarum]